MTINLTQPIPAAADWFVGMIDQAKIQAYISDYLEALRSTVTTAGPVNLNITAAGWSAGNAAPTYQKVGSWVQLGGQIQFSAATAPGSAWNGTAIFAALPNNCRPTNYKMFMCASGSQGAQVQVIAYSDGTIQMRNMGVSNLAAGQQFNLDGCAWYAGT